MDIEMQTSGTDEEERGGEGKDVGGREQLYNKIVLPAKIKIQYGDYNNYLAGGMLYTTSPQQVERLFGEDGGWTSGFHPSLDHYSN